MNGVYMPGNTPQEFIAKVLDNPPAELQNCYLCRHRRAKTLGIFFPTESFAKRIGQPKDKEWIVLYGLCGRCFEREDKAQAVEDLILKEGQVQ